MRHSACGFTAVIWKPRLALIRLAAWAYACRCCLCIRWPFGRSMPANRWKSSETPFCGKPCGGAGKCTADIKTQLSAQRGALVKVLLMPDGVDVFAVWTKSAGGVNTTGEPAAMPA